MAKVNLWLRGARGKFAGTSLSKGTNGETIAREVVTPTNPNTQKQRFQRAIMATCMTAYSAFSELFDHSFEGKSKGSACQQEFMKLNLRAMREAIAADMDAYNNGTQVDRLLNTVVLPKSEHPAPNAYIISKGTYDQYFFTLDMKRYDAEDEESVYAGLSLNFPAPTSGESAYHYAQRNNLIPGDIYTIVVLGCAEFTNYSLGVLEDSYDSITGLTSKNYQIGKNPEGTQTGVGCKSVNIYPAYYRMQVKNLENTNAAASNNISQYFDLTEVKDEHGILIPFESIVNGSFLARKHNTLNYYHKVLCAGIIRSRLDKDLRSTSRMVLANNQRYFGDTPQCYTGITAPCIPNSWENSAVAIGTSDLILESGN